MVELIIKNSFDILRKLIADNVLKKLLHTRTARFFFF